MSKFLLVTNRLIAFHVKFSTLLICLSLLGICSCSISGSPDPKQIMIPEGHVKLGSDPKEKREGYRLGGKSAIRGQWFDQELQRHVFLPQYFIDQMLVTQEDYEQFVIATEHRVPFITQEDYQKQGFLVHSYKIVQNYLWYDGHPPANLRDHPVVLVSFDDAEAYCQWKGNHFRKKYRLPTEDEWEKAARGIDQRYFPWGNQWNPAQLNTAQNGPYRTTPVDQYPQGVSPYGLYDMAGSVFQWTQTLDTSSEKRAVLKGCSWDDNAGICRSAARHTRLKDSRHILIGFRCAWSE